MKMNHTKLSRRTFLRLSSVTAGAAFLAACAPSGAPAAAPAGGEAAGQAPAAAANEVRYASWDWFAYVPGQTWADYNETEASFLSLKVNFLTSNSSGSPMVMPGKKRR